LHPVEAGGEIGISGQAGFQCKRSEYYESEITNNQKELWQTI
jgi:hypothetical protein